MLLNRKTLSMAGPVKGLIVFNAIANLLISAAGVAQVVLIVRLLEKVFLGVWSGRDVAITALGLGAVVAFRFLCTIALHRSAFRIASRLRLYLRDKLFRTVLSRELGYQKEISTGSLASLAVDGVEALEVYFGRYLPQLLVSMLAPVGLFIFLAPVHLPSAAVLLAAVPLIPLSIIAVNRWARRVAGSFWNRYESLSSYFLESMQGLTTLKLFNRDADRASDLAEKSWLFRNDTMRLLRMQLTSISLIDLLGLGGTALAVILAARDIAAGALHLTGGMLVLLLAAEFFLPLRRLGSYYHAGINGVMAVEKIEKFFAGGAASRECGCSPGAREGTGIMNMPRISFEGVYFAYEPGRPALEDFNLVIEPGSTLALVGESGAGKSTVAHLLLGFLQPDRGVIRWNGHLLPEIPREQLRMSMAMISQHTYIFAGSIADNLRLAKADADDKELMEACHRVGLALDLETSVGEQGVRLSGGQKQKVALARAMLRNAPVYVFDEVTANVDAAGEEQIWRAIHGLSAGKTSLIITHRLSAIRGADRIIVLDNGRVVECGTHGQLMLQGGLYRKMVEEQRRLEAYTEEDAGR